MRAKHSILGFLIAAILASNASATTWSLSDNSPLGENFLDAAVEPVALSVSADLHRDSGGSWDRTAAECFAAPSKFVPNPNGRIGNAATQAKTQETIRDLQVRGFTEIQTEARFRPGSLGSGTERYADIVGRNPVTGQSEIIQIGRTIKSDPRVPVLRERQALDDIIFSPTIQNYPNSTIRFIDVNRPGVIQP